MCVISCHLHRLRKFRTPPFCSYTLFWRRQPRKHRKASVLAGHRWTSYWGKNWSLSSWGPVGQKVQAHSVNIYTWATIDCRHAITMVLVCIVKLNSYNLQVSLLELDPKTHYSIFALAQNIIKLKDQDNTQIFFLFFVSCLHSSSQREEGHPSSRSRKLFWNCP